MTLKLLHIITDEKFPDAAYEQFEEILPGASTYLLPGRKSPIVYLKKIKPVRVSHFSFLNPFFIQSLNNYDAIILHSMTPFTLELIARANSKVIFVWIGLGYDYYDLIYPNPYDMLEEETAKIVKKTIPSFETPKSSSFLKSILKSLIYSNQKNKIEVIQKVKIFCPVLPEEGEIIEEKIGKLKPKIVQWNYASHVSLFNYNLDKCTSNNILVGNSATPTNNHYEIFKELSKLKLSKNTKVIVPLSYGDSKYREEVIKAGYNLLGHHFNPVTKFLEINEYIKIVKSCSIIIMNHIRQQGVGNITIGLYMGAKIFLNEKNPLYKNYINKGFTIYSTETLHISNDRDINRLPPEETKINQLLLQKHSSTEKVKIKTENLIKEIKLAKN
ncbi:TDP-N-acetylfucosamine:lipid II N-acetylfucosaminyltransferase family protein [Acinetobacter indicus]|uniref:TDP-N-acetylfucosamine:lipid II N-acetylfucosaminyltransferase n=1 Tax=Acinetobacter indicus TaxID=756892 RepID=UPI00143FD863|nr:TDP-N-acetylfucosamine:lipid II N-acetylfucosaminyltransferase [Acinetobacter indicus]QIZ59038.1 hypothetical protein FK537_07865 [Acinetobacter indicus]